MERKFDLDERLINFADKIIDISETLPKTFAGNHIAGQLASTYFTGQNADFFLNSSM